MLARTSHRVGRFRNGPSPPTFEVNKKIKKKIAALTKKLATLRQALAGVKRQQDEEDEVPRLSEEIRAIEEELEKLKAS